MEESTSQAFGTTQQPEESEAVVKRRRNRSPNFPSTDLATALLRARDVYEKEGQHAVPLAAVAEDWNYSPKSSGVRSLLATLKQFGLIDDEGVGSQRSVQLSR